MLPGDGLAVDRMEEQGNPTEGRSSVKPAQEILSARDGGNTGLTDLISIQPPSAAASPDSKNTTCPQCGPPTPDHRVPGLPPARSQRQGSSRIRRSSGPGSKRAASTQSDSCFRLLLACLWCQCSVVLLGLLEACSSCCHALCASCCQACARCCSAVQDVPVEELSCHAHCHSVLFESCCEHTECLEFCLECCELCHRS